MEKTLKIFVCVLFTLLWVSCKKDSDNEKTFKYLNSTGKFWFNGIGDQARFKTNTGLSDSYSIVKSNSTIMYGEYPNFWYVSSLYDFDFNLRIINRGDGIECLYCEYNSFISSYYNSVRYQLEITPPYSVVDFFYYPASGATISGLIRLKDSTINKTLYKDLFLVNINNNLFPSATALKAMYFSRTYGLVAFVTQYDIIWYKE